LLLVVDMFDSLVVKVDDCIDEFFWVKKMIPSV
jgi:hypothetical protein